MSSIILQYVLEDTFASKAIAWFSQASRGAAFSHVDALFWDGNNTKLLGARNGKVGGAPPGVWLRDPAYTVSAIRQTQIEIAVTDRQYDDWRRFLEAQIGKPYDTTAIWAFVLGRNWREEDSWFCPELQTAAAETAGIINKGIVHHNKITPIMSAEIMSLHPNALVRVIR